MKSHTALYPDMRIAFFTQALSTGGVGKVLLNLAHEFLHRGVGVDLLLEKAGGPYLEALDPAVRVIKMGSTHRLFGLPRLTAYLRRDPPTALVTDKIRVNILALRARKLSGAPTRICAAVHVPLSHRLSQLKPSKAASKLRHIQRYLPQNHCVIAVSEGVANDLVDTLGIPAHLVHTVFNPVVTPEMLRRAQEPLEHPWFMEGAPPVLLGAGRFQPQKDFSTLIRAFARLRASADCRLMILGQGQELPALEALARKLGVAESVAFPGFVPNPYNYMARARLFVLSSAWEGFGNVLAEAMALGVPVVSTDCEYGPSEILERGEYGPLVPVGDWAALAEAMQRVLSRPPEPDLLRAAASRYSVSASVDGYLQALGPREASP